jgi:Uma2 family endonuclease
VKGAILRTMDVPTYSIDEYVALERFSNVKHEYIDGQIRAMSGGTLEHARLAAALIGQLSSQLSGRNCDVYTSDARIHVVTGNLITYPDVTICCGQPRTGTQDPLAMVNPIVIVEVTSPSSEKYDRGTKFQRYQLIPSLREYVIVGQHDQAIDVFRRNDDDEWTAEHAGAGQRAKLLSINCEIDVDALFKRRG